MIKKMHLGGSFASLSLRTRARTVDLHRRWRMARAQPGRLPNRLTGAVAAAAAAVAGVVQHSAGGQWNGGAGKGGEFGTEQRCIPLLFGAFSVLWKPGPRLPELLFAG